MRPVAIALDGVLRKPLDKEAQDMGGILLYRALISQFRVVVLGTVDVERDAQFAMINGLNDYVKIEPLIPGDHGDIRNQIKRLRAEGFIFEFVVVPDPWISLDLMEEGFPVLTYTHPRFSPREQKGLTPWSSLASRVDSDLMARAESALK